MRAQVTLRRGEARLGDLSEALNRLGIDNGEDFVICRPHEVDPEEVNGIGPFQRSSETSRAAAVDNYPRQLSQRHRVLITIANAGDQGRTRDELGAMLSLRDGSVDPRVWELERGGFVENSGKTRTTSSGSEASVMVLTPAGRDAVEAHDPWELRRDG